MIVDCIVVWPSNCDYPLWREYIHRNRQLFNEVIIAFMETNTGFDFRPFVRKQVFADHIMTLDSPPPGGGDWRNVAINAALLHSYNAPYVWFTEQDFYPNPGFWEWIEAHPAPVYYVMQGERIHPCSLLLHRDVLKKLKPDFSAKPPEYDHFGNIQKQLQNMLIPHQIIPEKLYFHHNGLSHNWRLISEGQKPVYKPAEFYAYLRLCLKCSLELHPEYYRIAKQALLTENA